MTDTNYVAKIIQTNFEPLPATPTSNLKPKIFPDFAQASTRVKAPQKPRHSA